eukprot:COSAG06_NODE_8952_length_2025_cov_34.929907_2_plen_292_part_00
MTRRWPGALLEMRSSKRAAADNINATHGEIRLLAKTNFFQGPWPDESSALPPSPPPSSGSATAAESYSGTTMVPSAVVSGTAAAEADAAGFSSYIDMPLKRPPCPQRSTAPRRSAAPLSRGSSLTRTEQQRCCPSVTNAGDQALGSSRRRCDAPKPARSSPRAPRQAPLRCPRAGGCGRHSQSAVQRRRSGRRDDARSAVDVTSSSFPLTPSWSPCRATSSRRLPLAGASAEALVAAMASCDRVRSGYACTCSGPTLGAATLRCTSTGQVGTRQTKLKLQMLELHSYILYI